MFSGSYTTFAAVCLAGLVEGVGIPWPGGLIIAGAAASMGESSAAVPVVAALFTLGYYVGALLQYLIGRLIGPAALAWLPAVQRKRLDSLILKHGLGIVLWLRPFAVGNYVSLPAGMMRMPLPRFTLYTIVGIAPWAVGIALAGWFLGAQVVSSVISQWFLPAAVVLAVGLALFRGVKRWLRRRSRRHEVEVAAGM
jgi:membrane protein DedA with SNARE-associated domain